MRWMSLEKKISCAYEESALGTRKGDSKAEVLEIQSFIRNAKTIIVPNWNEEKLHAINHTLKIFGIRAAVHLQFYTNCCDVSRMPALTKAEMALDMSEGDLIIARGRLGVPGSGSMLIIMDKKGRILSAALSPPHVIHNKTVGEAVQHELIHALERIGFERDL